jgi:hypothetical protein
VSRHAVDEHHGALAVVGLGLHTDPTGADRGESHQGEQGELLAQIGIDEVVARRDRSREARDHASHAAREAHPQARLRDGLEDYGDQIVHDTLH